MACVLKVKWAHMQLNASSEQPHTLPLLGHSARELQSLGPKVEACESACNIAFVASLVVAVRVCYAFAVTRTCVCCQVSSGSSESEGVLDEEALEAVLGELIGKEPDSDEGEGERASGNVGAQSAEATVAGRPVVGNASASSGDPVPPRVPSHSAPPIAAPTSPRPAPSVASSVQRDVADVTVALAHGHISYYEKGDRFQATCTQPGHVRCRLTRTSRASDRRSAQGRPVGLMCAWLAAACNPQDHRNAFLVNSFDSAARRSARHDARVLPAMPALEACERAKRQDEASEPEEVP